MAKKSIIIATRKSPMALWQAEFIKKELGLHYPHCDISLLPMSTVGDERTDVPLTEIGGKSLFVKSLQQALLDKRADIAVHSIKDMSVHAVAGLDLAAVYKRDDPRDALISNNYSSFLELPENATIGTSSPRRQALLCAIRPNITPTNLRGNVGTRLKKLDDGHYDAIVLSAAGLHRLGLKSRITEYFNPEQFIPAIGQGTLGIECASQDSELIKMLQCLNHRETQLCIAAERAVNQRLGGDCHSPIGAYARIDGPQMHLKAIVSDAKGHVILTSEAAGPVENAQLIGISVANDLIARGANDIL
jgi:hydroxymethylbilane synthase